MNLQIRNVLAALLVAGAVLTATSCSTMESMIGMTPAPAKTADGVLTNDAGRTLYTFDRDTSGSGKSVCNGPCAASWPPFAAGADAKPTGEYTIITRDDGARQWAYKGKPLYTWVKDTKPGDKTGDGFNNVWKVATP